MKNIWIFALMILCVHQGYSQFSLSGRISDPSGNPLAGAHVVLEGSYRGTLSGPDGYFNLGKFRKGNYTLEASFMGFESSRIPVDLAGDMNIEIELLPKSILADEVVVIATRAGEKMPVAFQNLTREELAERNTGQDIPFLLSMTPSLVSTSDAGTGIGYTSMRIRGSDASRINVTINGIPLNDPESHMVYWVDLPDFVSSVENLQIQRGAGTSTNGAGAFGASINLQTNSLNKEPYAGINLKGGSFATAGTSLVFGTGLLRDRLVVDGRVSYLSSDGYIDRAWAKLKSGYLSLGYYRPRSLVRLNLFSGFEETYQAWYGVPREALDTNRTYNPYHYENEIDHYIQSHAQLLFSSELSDRFLLNAAIHYTRGAGYYEQLQETANYFHQTFLGHYGLPDVIIGNDTIRQTDLVRRLWLDNHFYGSTFSLAYKNARFQWLTGGAVNHYLGGHYGKLVWARYASESDIGFRWYENTGNKLDFNLYSKITFSPSGLLSFFGDLQFRNIRFRIRGDENGLADIGQERHFVFWNPKAGVFLNAGGRHAAYFSVSVANREPSRDNYVDAIAAGKEEPMHETMIDYELGYSSQNNLQSLSLNLYYMDYYNQLVATGEINHVGMPIMSNIPRSYRLGIEAEWKFRLERFSCLLNATISRNKIRSFTEKIEFYDGINTWNYLGIRETDLGETCLAFSPDLVLNNMLRYDLHRSVRVEFISQYISRQYIDNTSETERSLDPYLVNHLKLEWNAKLFKTDGIRLYVRVNNILNHEYETNAWVYRAAFSSGEEYADFGYFPQAGRNILAGLSVLL